jgi:hypothetical protein
MTTAPATPRTRSELRPAAQAWQAVLAELRKDDDRATQLGKALWSLYHLTEQLLTEHMPCRTKHCLTCCHLADTLTVFYAVDALWATGFDEKGGAT